MWDQIEEALNQSATRILTRIAKVLPGALAVLVALLVSAILAWAVRVLLVRFLTAVKFDERMARWKVSDMVEWSGAKSPALVVARVAFWVVILTGLLIGVSASDETLLTNLMSRFFESVPALLGGLILILAGNLLARFLARGVLISAVNMNLQYARLLSVGVKWLIWVLVTAMALDHVGIGGRIVELAFGILFGGIVLALALAVGLGSKELVSRSIERKATQKPEPVEEPFRHL